MSSWQSFFNELSRPQRNNVHYTSELICRCEKGELIRNLELEYIHAGECSSDCFCAIIEIDKRSARKFSNTISISKIEGFNCNKDVKSSNNSLDQYLDDQNS